MKRMRKNNTIILLVILLLSLSIGYALINTNLKINGTANVTKQTWDIHFENIQVTEGSVTTQNPAIINPEYPTTVTYNIHLENPGDFYEFEVDAVNNGSIDAMITSIVSTNNANPINLPSYMEYKVTYESGTALDENQILEANTKETYTVGIYFKKDIQASELINSQPLDLRLKFEVTYGMATDEAEQIGDITVTFNPNGGTVSKTSKKVVTNGKYGNLPTPTRPGYKFKGWHGVNELPELIESNYTTYNYSDRTSQEFKSENNKKYIHIIGNQSTSNIDTSWYFKEKSNNLYEQSADYILSLDVRSKNCVSNQFIRLRDANTAAGKTGIYLSGTTGFSYESVIAPLLNNMNFANDGNWHRISSILTTSSGDTNGFFAMGNDSPNIYGDGCYLDIGNIQIQKGATATPYEPYYITKNTTVVQTADHTLTAIWEPTACTVTLDYNDGVTDSTTVQVAYGSTYENLPSPTRTGYTFKGWNGKNKTNFDLNNIAIINISTGNRYAYDLGKLSQGTYTISYDLIDENVIPTYLYFIKMTSNNEATRLSYLTTTVVSTKSYTFNADGDSNYYMVLANGNDSTLALAQQKFSMLKDIQLELGSRVTAYEPYYITNNTPLVQNTDHTLTAIWEVE